MSDYLVYIGTYSSGDEDGIYVYRLDMATGALAYQSSIGGIDNPSFLPRHCAQPPLPLRHRRDQRGRRPARRRDCGLCH